MNLSIQTAHCNNDSQIKMKTIGIINGPNLDRLGKRDPGIYGTQTLADLQKLLEIEAAKQHAKLFFFQSNHEGEIIDKINEWAEMKFDGAIINPAAYSHTSIGIRDAISGSNIPFIEVHISNIYQREQFRHHSFTAGACKGAIAGLGFSGYLLALEFLIKEL